jgi:hypothetical protein
VTNQVETESIPFSPDSLVIANDVVVIFLLLD